MHLTLAAAQEQFDTLANQAGGIARLVRLRSRCEAFESDLGVDAPE